MHAWQLMCFQEEEGWPCDLAVHHSRHVHTECTMEQSAICMHCQGFDVGSKPVQLGASA